MKKILFIVDPQNDFIDGSLAVKGSKEIMDGLSRYIGIYGNDYEAIVISCDQHPINHCSFITEGGQWPMHCIAHTVGAALYPPISDAVINYKLAYRDRSVMFIEKGKNPTKEEYSAVDSKKNQEYVERIIDTVAESINEPLQIDVCGIAGDICVLNTIKGLIEMGYGNNLFILADFCPSIDDGTILDNFIRDNKSSNSFGEI